MDRMDGGIKHVFQKYIDHVNIYILKRYHKNSYGFQNLMSSWGCGSKVSKITIGSILFFV